MSQKALSYSISDSRFRHAWQFRFYRCGTKPANSKQKLQSNYVWNIQYDRVQGVFFPSTIGVKWVYSQFYTSKKEAMTIHLHGCNFVLIFLFRNLSYYQENSIPEQSGNIRFKAKDPQGAEIPTGKQICKSLGFCFPHNRNTKQITTGSKGSLQRVKPVKRQSLVLFLFLLELFSDNLKRNVSFD
jgi:hypothetical protein